MKTHWLATMAVATCALLLAACGEEDMVNNRRGVLPPAPMNNDTTVVDMSSTTQTTPGDTDMSVPPARDMSPASDMHTPGMDMPRDMASVDMPPPAMDMSPPVMKTPAQEFADDVVDELVRLACENASTCPDKDNNSALLAGRYSSKQECLDEFGTKNQRARDILLAAQGAGSGRTTFDDTKTAQCMTDLTASVDAAICVTSEVALQLPPSCEGIFTGTRAEGESCVFDTDCATYGLDTACITIGDQCTGTCGSLRYNCSGTNCAIGEYCREGDNGQSTCTPRSNEGGPCKLLDDACRTDLICLLPNAQSTAATEGMCIRHHTVPNGEFCTFNLMCQSTFCFEQTCAQLPEFAPSQMGEPCAHSVGMSANELRSCAPGLVCTQLSIDFFTGSITGTCGAPVARGGACDAATECAPGLQCSMGTQTVPGRCIDVGTNGASCGADEHCASGFCSISNNSGTCRTLTACSN